MRWARLYLDKSAGFRLGSECFKNVYRGAGGIVQLLECLSVMHTKL